MISEKESLRKPLWTKGPALGAGEGVEGSGNVRAVQGRSVSYDHDDKDFWNG